MLERKHVAWLALILSQTVFLVLFPVWKKLFQYLNPVSLLVVWFCVTLFFFFFIFLFTKNKVTISTPVIQWITVIYSICLLILLFFRPFQQEHRSFNIVPLQTIFHFISGEIQFFIAFYNLAANILLFIPLGIAAIMLTKLSRASKWKLSMIPILLIMLIEIMQFVTNRGSLDVDDLLLNAAGIYLGYLLNPMVQKVIKVRQC